MKSVLAQLPTPPSLHDSVTHVIFSPRVSSIRGNSFSIRTCVTGQKASRLTDGGFKVCVTGYLGLLLNLMDINPLKFSVALECKPYSFDDCITKQGLLPLSLSDETTYYQTCYYCTNMVETIISPSAILASSNVFVQWTQVGFKDPTIPGRIRFSSHDRLLTMCFHLECYHSLYYCCTDVYTVDHNPVHIRCLCTTVATPLHVAQLHCPKPKFMPVTRAHQMESEVWALRFGSPEQAYIQKQAAQCTAK
jgi:hypothetical protein